MNENCVRVFGRKHSPKAQPVNVTRTGTGTGAAWHHFKVMLRELDRLYLLLWPPGLRFASASAIS